MNYLFPFLDTSEPEEVLYGLGSDCHPFAMQDLRIGLSVFSDFLHVVR